MRVRKRKTWIFFFYSEENAEFFQLHETLSCATKVAKKIRKWIFLFFSCIWNENDENSTTRNFSFTFFCGNLKRNIFGFWNEEKSWRQRVYEKYFNCRNCRTFKGKSFNSNFFKFVKNYKKLKFWLKFRGFMNCVNWFSLKNSWECSLSITN